MLSRGWEFSLASMAVPGKKKMDISMICHTCQRNCHPRNNIIYHPRHLICHAQNSDIRFVAKSMLKWWKQCHQVADRSGAPQSKVVCSHCHHVHHVAKSGSIPLSREQVLVLQKRQDFFNMESEACRKKTLSITILLRVVHRVQAIAENTNHKRCILLSVWMARVFKNPARSRAFHSGPRESWTK